MLRRLVPSEQLKRRKEDKHRSHKRLSTNLPLSPSKKCNINVITGHKTSQSIDNKVSHEEYIRKILSKPFVIPIDNYKGLN